MMAGSAMGLLCREREKLERRELENQEKTNERRGRRSMGSRALISGNSGAPNGGGGARSGWRRSWVQLGVSGARTRWIRRSGWFWLAGCAIR